MDTRVKAVLLVICAGIFGTTDGYELQNDQDQEFLVPDVEPHLEREIHHSRGEIFSASRSDSATDAAMGSCVVYDLVELNRGDAYDPQTGVFTCPTAGVYRFFFWSQYWQDGKRTELSLLWNGREVSDRRMQMPISGHLGFMDSHRLSLNVGDRVCVTLELGEIHGGPISVMFQGDACRTEDHPLVPTLCAQ